METFADLPDALVRELLQLAEPKGAQVAQNLKTLQQERQNLREQAEQRHVIRRQADLDVPREPSIVGVDGSYQIHRLTGADLVAAAAVAVEGTSREARRYWPEPYHRLWVDYLPHHTQTTRVLRALMMAMELDLANEAPHDVVLLDGSFASIIIYLNQGLTSLDDTIPGLADRLLEQWAVTRERLQRVLTSSRTAALPKYTSRKELSSRVGIRCPVDIDSKALATLILNPGEYTCPLFIFDVHDPESSRVDHLPERYCSPNDWRVIQSALDSLQVIYYRPYGWTPALRIEVPTAIAGSHTRLAMLLEGIKRQFFSPAVIEPYPLFIADRMVKSLGEGVAVIEQTISQHVVAELSNIETTLLFLQNYRTEGGRGGV